MAKKQDAVVDAEASTWGVLYRPKTFDDVIGNEQAKKVVQSFVDKKRPPAFILLSGPSGVGKTTFATLIAAAVNETTTDKNLDLYDFNIGNERGIESVRGMIESSKYIPRNNYRVMLLDEAHRFTKDSAAALLKPTETSGRTMWIMATTEPQAMLPTLITRSLHLPLTYPDRSELIKLGRRIAKREGVLEFEEYKKVYRKLADVYTDPRSYLNALGKAADLGEASKTPEGIAWLTQSFETKASLYETTYMLLTGKVADFAKAFGNRSVRMQLSQDFMLKLAEYISAIIETKHGHVKYGYSEEDRARMKKIADNVPLSELVDLSTMYCRLLTVQTVPYLFANIAYNQLVNFVGSVSATNQKDS